MADLKTVGIKELKNNLSAYLREVRAGTRVLVSDRNRVVAELHEPRAGQRFPVEPVRTLDALHLATALAFTRAFPDLRLLSLDRRVADNANALGIGYGTT